MISSEGFSEDSWESQSSNIWKWTLSSEEEEGHRGTGKWEEERQAEYCQSASCIWKYDKSLTLYN